jgi:hypothetical protein
VHVELPGPAAVATARRNLPAGVPLLAASAPPADADEPLPDY